ncbi:hypothetical protein [uncultured Rubinisphaera sp.]|uniref:hypothetical protein n=1 Tax=uncultured Rubinisphaera sp. TaxID=1678686 RepID=UPI000EEA7104|nr:hypothetical protein [Planctomycetaceae bacterium]
MSMLRISRKLILAAMLVTVVGIGSVNNAQAEACCYWKTVTVYVAVTKSYTYYVTRYDHCGHPYEIARTGYKTVNVPVLKKVKVCY